MYAALRQISSLCRRPCVEALSDLNMRSHVQLVALPSCVNCAVSDDQFQRLFVRLCLSKMDYGNDTLVGLPANLLNRLQSVLNAAAQSIIGLRRTAHITDTLASFHWLRALK